MAEAQFSVDRFSKLPPEIAHHILAFLPIADATRVSSLSNRCRALHQSNPRLNFDSFPSESTRTFDKRLELLNSLDRFLIQRGTNKVKYFSIHWDPESYFGETEIDSHSDLEKAQILGWIQYAVRCNVEELNIFFLSLMPTAGQFLEEIYVVFPSCVFLCESLRCASVELPSYSTCPPSNLVSLSLINVTIDEDEGFSKWVSYCCRFIKELVLDQVGGLEDIAIESLSLESLSVSFPCYFDIERLVVSGDKIKHIDICWEYDSSRHNNDSLLNISAPNLKYLKWDGNLLNHQQFGEMDCLEQVEISLTSGGVNELDRICEQFLCSISSAKVLRLDQATAKTLFREGFTPALFSNVWYLRVSIWCSIDDELVSALTSLFRAVPNLTTLKFHHLLCFLFVVVWKMYLDLIGDIGNSRGLS